MPIPTPPATTIDMKNRTRYSGRTVSPAQAAEIRRAFLKAAGPSFATMVEFFETIPEVAFVAKDAQGRIVHMNRYNLELCGWRSLDDVLGYTSEDLYEPDQAAVYAGRDREVMETGIPIIERIYGFVADRSTSLNCVTVRPVSSTSGRRIGTATVYWRARRTLQSEFWYGPIRKAVSFLGDHYAENVTVAELAEMAHYSVAQFRRRFHELMHQSPTEYLAEVRVNVAKTLLKTTDRSVSDIAAATGFFDHSHFIRVFRKTTGLTPLAYRRSRAARPI